MVCAQTSSPFSLLRHWYQGAGMAHGVEQKSTALMNARVRIFIAKTPVKIGLITGASIFSGYVTTACCGRLVRFAGEQIVCAMGA
jgi:hypothetical protein